MEKLDFFGVGPKIGRITFPWLAIVIFLSIRFHSFFSYSDSNIKIITYSGIVILLLGLILYFSTVPLLLKGLKESRLVTNGAYRLCCNPLYAAIILFIIPGTSLVMNSWLMLTVSLVGYIVFKLTIKSEYAEMEKFFGEEYRKYRNETPELFPVKFHKRTSIS
jgi:protein-S-isoprenylcysteine O-methyltransferase Ste14